MTQAAPTGGDSRWRPASPDDDAQLVALSAALYAEDPASVPVPDAHMRRTLAALREDPRRGRVLVLESRGVVAGYALVCGFWSNEHGGEVRLIDELYVAPAHRGGGHATRLLEELAATGDGAVALGLEITPGNTRARRLYERVGFRAGNQVMRRLI